MGEHMTTIEKEPQYKVTYLGRLGDLGLGNPDGIPSKYADADDAEIKAFGEELLTHLVEPSNETKLACMDGRHTLAYADGSEPEPLLRRVGGTGTNLSMALNSDSPVVKKFSPTDTLGHKIKVVDQYVLEMAGFEPSAHLGGCAGVAGEVAHQEAIHNDPSVIGATEKVMKVPQIANYFETTFDPTLAKRVVENAGTTAELLQASGWNGQQYVDGVVKYNPNNVEDLEVDHDDEKHHGHREDAFVIIAGNKTIEKDDIFVWNLKTTKKVAKAFEGERGKEGYTQAVIAETSKYTSIAKVLPSLETPVYLIEAA